MFYRKLNDPVFNFVIIFIMSEPKKTKLNINRTAKTDPNVIMALTMILDGLSEEDKKNLIAVLEKEGHKIDSSELYKKLSEAK